MHIILIEDEHRLANSIKIGLEQEKYEVTLAYDGQEGLNKAESDGYDLIILDLMLPKLDGQSICRKLREEEIHTPILILTAKSQVSDKVVLLDSGADDYLTKPFAFEEFLARIRALTRRTSGQDTNLLKYADLSMDVITHQVIRANKIINLSAREYSLLEYFLRHPNVIVTKDQIIEHVWSYDSDILTNTVEVFMKNLRRKIDLPFEIPLLKTVRGFGYQLTDK